MAKASGLARNDSVEDIKVIGLRRKIAEKQRFALRMAKEAVNAAQDLQGRKNSLLLGFAYHHLTHAHNQEVFGVAADLSLMKRMGRGRNE